MRAITCIASLVFSIQCSIAATPTTVPPEVAKEVKSLLDDLPPQRHLWLSHELVNNPPNDPNADKARMLAAESQVKRAYTIVPKVRKLLRVGASILDYPSLLAHGDITYQAIGKGDPFDGGYVPEYGYRLYVGLPVGMTRHTYDVEIIFDSSGIIREINVPMSKE